MPRLSARVLTVKVEGNPVGKKPSQQSRKSSSTEVIRTDVWDLSATLNQKQEMVLTIGEYRRFLKPLVWLVNAQWVNLAELTSKKQVNAVEKIIHKTADNPKPKHKYFQSVVNRYPSFRKFPSYLRRAAIADAIGIVSSFQTRYHQWQSGISF